MAQPKPRLKFTVNDYMSAPPGKRYQLLDGEMILMEGGADLAPAPSDKHQSIVVELLAALHRFITENSLGQIRVSPYDVVQPDLLFVSRERAGIITRANVQGAPDLVVEVLSPGTAQYDRGYKRTLYGRHGVREYWLVDPEAETIEVLTRTGRGLGLRATYHRGETLTSPLLAGLTLDLDQIFG
jgi:Uma2 family endonuclease